jgi:hypothetical protein
VMRGTRARQQQSQRCLQGQLARAREAGAEGELVLRLSCYWGEVAAVVLVCLARLASGTL